MKRISLIVITLVAALVVAGTAQAADLSYALGRYSSQVPAGGTVNVPLSVTVNGLAGTAELTFVGSTNGPISSSWVSASPETAGVSADNNNASTQLTIHVPANAAPGSMLWGQVFADVDSGASINRGAYIRLMVTEPVVNCSESPDIGEPSVSPEQISIPNNRMVDVTITGVISNPAGCESLNMNYQLGDNAPESFSINENGEFTITVQVKATRAGYEKSGKTYEITLSAQNETGISARTVNVNVLHDRR